MLMGVAIVFSLTLFSDRNTTPKSTDAIVSGIGKPVVPVVDPVNTLQNSLHHDVSDMYKHFLALNEMPTNMAVNLFFENL